MNKIIIVSGLVIVENNKVLLNQHGDTDFWKFCGGKVENDDISLIETAKRESKEELGIDVEVVDSEPFFTYSKKETSEGVHDVILVHFLAKRSGSIVYGADIREWEWLDINSLPKNIAPNIIPALKHFKFIK
jgi:8-oxo-dGTP pyrophosphatase MutT (NUDIX family)